MGTVVFVMVELTGIDYGSIIIAATIPALLYYFAVFLAVDFEAINLNLVGLTKSELPSIRESAKSGYSFLLTIIALLYSLFILESSVARSALYALGAISLVAAFQIRNPKIFFKKVIDALYEGGIGTIKLASLTAGAGIIIGTVSLTGLGVKMGRFLLDISGGQLSLVLFFTMLLCLILGMGMSTIPAYVIAAAVGAPAMLALGIPVLQTHLFVLYYGIISTITPPVAISAFTAAGIADADPMETAFMSVKMAYVGFFVPFLFVYRPALLMQGSLGLIAYTVILSIIAIYSLTRGIQYKKNNIFERILLIVGAMMMLFPGNDLIGFGLVALSYILYFVRNKGLKQQDKPDLTR